MQIEAGQFIASLRNRLAGKLTGDEEKSILAAFDRACIEVIVGAASSAAPVAPSKPTGKKANGLSPAKKRKHSERMKEIWAERKRKQATEAERQEADAEA
jgi:hypothetical protein